MNMQNFKTYQIKNSQFPNANYNKMSFMFLKRTYKTILYVVDIS